MRELKVLKYALKSIYRKAFKTKVIDGFTFLGSGVILFILPLILAISTILFKESGIFIGIAVVFISLNYNIDLIKQKFYTKNNLLFKLDNRVLLKYSFFLGLSENIMIAVLLIYNLFNLVLNIFSPASIMVLLISIVLYFNIFVDNSSLKVLNFLSVAFGGCTVYFNLNLWILWMSFGINILLIAYNGLFFKSNIRVRYEKGIHIKSIKNNYLYPVRIFFCKI